MDEALVKNSEHDVNGGQRGDNQERSARKGGLKCLQCSRITTVDRARHSNGLFHLADANDGISKRDPRRKVERERHGGKLSLVIYGDGRGGRLIFCNGAQWNDGTAIGCAQVDLV